MPQIRRVTAAAMLAGIVLIGSACSSSKGPSTTTTPLGTLSPETTAPIGSATTAPTSSETTAPSVSTT